MSNTEYELRVLFAFQLHSYKISDTERELYYLGRIHGIIDTLNYIDPPLGEKFEAIWNRFNKKLYLRQLQKAAIRIQSCTNTI